MQMSHGEGFPVAQEEVPQEGVYFEDRTINEAFAQGRYGLGVEELTQIVVFGDHTGTVADMLDDDKCPVGRILAKAYAQGGIEAVEEQFGNLSKMDESFQAKVFDTTKQREALKKNLSPAKSPPKFRLLKWLN